MVRSPLLAGVPGVAHGFTTRALGSMAGTVHPRGEQQQNRRSLERAVGMTLVRVKQVAGSDIALVVNGTAERVRDRRSVTAGDPSDLDADAIMSLERGVALAVAVADCVPVLIATEEGWLGVAHAGWAGTARGVVTALCGELARRGADLARARSAVGPAIGPCCYTLGADRAAEIRASSAARHLKERGDGLVSFDLWAANAAQLEAAGVPDIDIAGVCTADHVGRFYSHRGEAGAAGRNLAFIGRRS